MGLQFNLMINEKDLEGEPLPGRRFRGVIWLLGEVEFLTKFAIIAKPAINFWGIVDWTISNSSKQFS